MDFSEFIVTVVSFNCVLDLQEIIKKESMLIKMIEVILFLIHMVLTI